MIKFIKLVKSLLIIPLFLFSYSLKAIEIFNENDSIISFDGKMQTAYLSSKDKKNRGDFSSFHLGFKLESKLNDNLYAYSKWQHRFINRPESKFGSVDNNTNTRIFYMGLKYKNFGSFDYGRNIGLINKTLSITNVLQKLDNPYNQNNVFSQGTATSLFTYHNKNFFGLVNGFNFDLQYQGQNNYLVNRSSSLEINGPGYAVYTSYKHNKVTFSSSYADMKRIDIQNKLKYGKSDRAQILAAGIKYDSDSIYIAATYTENLYATPINFGFSNKTHGVEFSFKGKLFNNTLKPVLSYSYKQANSIDFIDNPVDLVHYLAVGTTYNFSKNFNIYAEYKFNFLDKQEINKQISNLNIPRYNVAALGVNYYF